MLGLLFQSKTTGFIPILYLSRAFTKLPQLGLQFRRLQSTTNGTGEKSAELVKDVLLYKHENPKFILYVGMFSLLQFTFWNFLGTNMLSLKDLPVSSDEDTPFWKRINWGESSTKRIMSSGCFLIGNLTLTIGCLFILRSIRYIVLRKSREVVSVVTYTPFGRNRFIEVQLSNISCQGSRTGGGYMPIKIKGRWFMFVADLRPEFSVFPNPRLFDQTVGIHRKF